MDLYNHTLHELEKELGSEDTYSNDLESTGKRMFKSKFVGVFPADQIPDLAEGQYAIINLDFSDQPGSHWTAISMQNGGKVFYDSFGRNHKRILPSLGRAIDTESDAEQVKSENNCGPRSLAFLMVLDKMGLQAALTI
jgi:hypothetical protein